MKYVIGIDLGTSATKTVLFDSLGCVICSASREYPLYQPHNGWAEQDPEDWVVAALATLRHVVEQSGVDVCDIVSIGLSGQMHGLVLLDGQGQVLRPAILWCDGRTEPECEELTRLLGRQTLIDITANPALPGFTASKILWVRRHEPRLFARAAHVLLPKDYLRFRLTGKLAAEYSDASGMQLLDIRKREWSPVMAEAVGITTDMLAPLCESCEAVGTLLPSVAEQTGLSAATLVVGGAGDNAAAAVGTGTVREGSAFATVGTSGVVYAHTDAPLVDPKGRIHTFCSAVPGAYHVMGVTQAAGLSLRWLRDTCCKDLVAEAARVGEDVYVAMDRLAAAVPVGADRLLYLPYLMGERTPHLDASARGVFFGLSAKHETAHLIRAVMEGVTYSLCDCLRVIRETGIHPTRMLLTGGGGKSPLWRSMLCDTFALPVKTLASDEGASLGAAILAAVGAGLYPTVQTACDSMVRSCASLQDPDGAQTELYHRHYGLYTQLYHSLREDFATLATL